MEALDLHLSEEDLELYALGRSDEYLTDVVEDHLLQCPACRMALDLLEEDLVWMRVLLR